MQNAVRSNLALDELSASAIAGSRDAEEILFLSLRVRFLTIAKSRVQEEDAEDVVQETLRIVHAKYGSRSEGAGILIWGLAILRNVIGNYYQKRKRDSTRMIAVEDSKAVVAGADEAGARTDGTGDPLGESSRTVDEITEAITRLTDRYPRCGAIFRGIIESLAQGGGRQEVSQRAMKVVLDADPKMTRGGFYVALHRCRFHLRQILEAKD